MQLYKRGPVAPKSLAALLRVTLEICAKKDDVNGSNKNRSTDRLGGGDSLCPNSTRTSLHSVISMITLAEHTGGPVALATGTRASDEQKGSLCAQETFCAARPVSLGLHSYQ